MDEKVWRRQQQGNTITENKRFSHLKTIFRYPGAKGRYLNQILPFIPSKTKYHDVFVGGGSVTLAYACANPSSAISVNDLDSGIFSFWQILVEPDTTIKKLFALIDQQPTVEQFVRLKHSTPETLLEKAYRIIFLNRCAFSGIVTSGPMGGYNQTGESKIDSRYNAEQIKYRILSIRKLLKDRLTVHNQHVADYLETVCSGEVAYLDPPYYAKGKDLYPVHMMPNEHLQLSNILQNMNNWVLSYDAHAEIRRLYQGFSVISHLKTKYSIANASGKAPVALEYIITPKVEYTMNCISLVDMVLLPFYIIKYTALGIWLGGKATRKALHAVFK